MSGLPKEDLGRFERAARGEFAARGPRDDREEHDLLVTRYGDFVRYRIPLKATTVLLWLGPFLLLLVGGTTLAVALRRRAKKRTDPALSDEDHRTVAQRLSEGTTRS